MAQQWAAVRGIPPDADLLELVKEIVVTPTWLIDGAAVADRRSQVAGELRIAHPYLLTDVGVYGR